MSQKKDMPFVAVAAELIALSSGCSTPAPMPAGEASKASLHRPYEVRSLRSLMKNRVNAAAEAVSFWISNEAEGKDDEKFGTIVQSAQILARHDPPFHADRRDAYEELALQLKGEAAGLGRSGHRRLMPEAVERFTRLKETCVACHRTYRFGEPPPVRDAD